MSKVLGVLAAIGRAILAALAAIGSVIAKGFTFLWQKSKVAATVLLVLIAAGCWLFIDSSLMSEKIYKGVHVGTVDVSNMSVEDAAAAIDATYKPNLEATSVYIFADEETANSADLDLMQMQSEAIAEQISFEEAQREKKLWIASAETLNASLPSQELAQQALEVGRSTGVLERIGAALSGREIEVYAHFDETLLGNMISDINATIGYSVNDYGVKIEDGQVSVTEGNVGYLLDNHEFTKQVSDSLLKDDSHTVSFVAEVEYTPFNVGRESAERTRDAIDALLPDSVSFDSEGNVFDIERDMILNWVTTVPRQDGDTWVLDPYIDHGMASSDMLQKVNQSDEQREVEVEFVNGQDGSILVKPTSEVSVPNVASAIDGLDRRVFEAFRNTQNVGERPSVDTIGINTEQFSSEFTVDEALSYGLVTKFSDFTTQYTNTSSTSNRTYNIHLAADKIANSVAKANGGQWSFNQIAGNTNEDGGFKAAKVIESGEYTDGVGGGVCQVATTVFNAVFNAGFPINERYNHTLYSSSYPAGMDAAIAYPTLDLRWTNNTGSDVLLTTSYTDTSVTVSLVGTNPNLEVETVTGDWIDGKEYKVKFEEDELLEPNTSIVKTQGTNGMQINVERIVRDADGNELSRSNFFSSYSPINKIIAYGKGSDMAALHEKYDKKEEKASNG